MDGVFEPEYKRMMFWVFVAFAAAIGFAIVAVELTVRYVQPLA